MSLVTLNALFVAIFEAVQMLSGYYCSRVLCRFVLLIALSKEVSARHGGYRLQYESG